MLTDDQRRERGLALAAQVQVFLRGRFERLLERAREGRANTVQVREARAAYVAATRALAGLKRGTTWSSVRRSA